MLRVKFKYSEDNFLKSQDKFFKYEYENDWFDDKYIVDMVRDVDGVEHFADSLFKSDIFGYVEAEGLSSGVKGLILMYKGYDKIFNGDLFGDNCCKWIYDISTKRDITVWMSHILEFPNIPEFCLVEYGKEDKIINAYEDYIRLAINSIGK